MSNVFFDVVASLDGYIAPEGMDMEHFDDPAYKQWMVLLKRLFLFQDAKQKSRPNLASLRLAGRLDSDHPR